MAERIRLVCFGGVCSNHHALAATLGGSRRSAVDHVWCLGDLGGFGPHPDRAIEMLRAAQVPTLRGNMDDSVGHERDDCALRLHRSARSALRPALVRLHARAHPSRASRLDARTARSSSGWIWGTPRPALPRLAAPRERDSCGNRPAPQAFLEWLCDAPRRGRCSSARHTGLPWHRALSRGRHVVNAGVIGRPANDGDPAVRYALLTLDGDVGVEVRPRSL